MRELILLNFIFLKDQMFKIDSVKVLETLENNL